MRVKIQKLYQNFGLAHFGSELNRPICAARVPVRVQPIIDEPTSCLFLSFLGLKLVPLFNFLDRDNWLVWSS